MNATPNQLAMSIILDRSTVYVDNFNIHRIHPVTEVRQKRTKVEAMRPNNHELPKLHTTSPNNLSVDAKQTDGKYLFCTLST